MARKNDDSSVEPLSLAGNLRQTAHTVDGLAWLAVTAVSIVCLVDVAQGGKIIPLKNASDPYKASVLLLLSSLVTFLYVVGLRRLVFINPRFDSWIRAILCVVMFSTFNF